MQYLTLEEYTLFAKKLILRQLGNRYLTDENIAHVVYYIANADKTYSPDKGTKRSTFRMICGLHGVQTLHRLKNKKSCISLSMRLSRADLSDIIEDKRFSEKESTSNISIQDVMNSVNLSKRERKYLELYLQDNKIKDIAEECGISKQAVGKAINNAIKKMRNAYV